MNYVLGSIYRLALHIGVSLQAGTFKLKVSSRILATVCLTYFGGQLDKVSASIQ